MPNGSIGICNNPATWKRRFLLCLSFALFGIAIFFRRAGITAMGKMRSIYLRYVERKRRREYNNSEEQQLLAASIYRRLMGIQ